MKLFKFLFILCGLFFFTTALASHGDPVTKEKKETETCFSKSFKQADAAFDAEYKKEIQRLHYDAALADHYFIPVTRSHIAAHAMPESVFSYMPDKRKEIYIKAFLEARHKK